MGQGRFRLVHNGDKLLFGNPEEKTPTQGPVNADQSLWQLVIIGTAMAFVVSGNPVVFQVRHSEHVVGSQ
jgi:hypothetical protein